MESGWRSPAYNARKGGAVQSQHMLGKAADIAPLDVDVGALRLGEATQRDKDRVALFAAFCEKQIARLDAIGGIGCYPGWVHLDIRPRGVNGHVARWFGTKVGDEK